MSEWFIIEVEFSDLDGETNTDIYGPYHSHERAKSDCANLNNHLDRIPQDSEGNLTVLAMVRPIFPTKIRSITRGARLFIERGEYS